MKRRKLFEAPQDSDTQISVERSGPKSDLSQASESAFFFKRLRAKTFYIHEHIHIREHSIICNRCDYSYKISGGTEAISRYLKDKPSIDSAASSIAEKRIRDETAIDIALGSPSSRATITQIA